MTKVYRKGIWDRDVVEMDLVSALTPDNSDAYGVAERAADDARKALECVGNLAALLVENGHIKLADASKAMGHYQNLYRTRAEAEGISEDD